MFTKTRGDEPQRTSAAAPSPTPNPPEKKPRAPGVRPATLGASISISGNLTGNEDLVIEGAVEGEVRVNDHMVTISETGRVKADVYGRNICVEGEVEGNLAGDEQVIIRKSGRVRGNVRAPRVNLENGAKFKGSIDMQPAESKPAPATSSGKASSGSRERSSSAAAGATGAGRLAGETA